MELKNKKTYILFAAIGICLLVVLFQILFHFAFPSTGDPYGDEWYEAEAAQQALDHIRAAEHIDAELRVIKYSYTDYDQKIVEENRTSEIKKYPFSKVEVVVESRRIQYTVGFLVDENGELQVEGFEKEHHFNPFLKEKTSD